MGELSTPPTGDGAMSAGAVERPPVAVRTLAVLLLAAACWDAWGLFRHPGFQPVAWLRMAAPVVALLLAGGFTRLLARARAPADAQREFDRAGKALFMGFVMVGATLLAWLLVSQAVPATFNALAGRPGEEAGVVLRRVLPSADADCRFRLEVASAAGADGAVPRPLDECVDEAVWTRAAERGPATLQLVRSPVGAELVGVGS